MMMTATAQAMRNAALLYLEQSLMEIQPALIQYSRLVADTNGDRCIITETFLPE